MKLDRAFELCGLNVHDRQDLIDTLSEPHRKFHNLKYVERVLAHMNDTDDVIAKAALFHRAYLPEHSVPEGLSASMSVGLYVKLTGDVNVQVAEAITAAANQTKTQDDLRSTSKLFLDYTLAHLATEDISEYEQDSADSLAQAVEIYEQATLAEIKAAKASVLKDLARRKKIFYMRTEWEKRARANISIEIDWLLRDFHDER